MAKTFKTFFKHFPGSQNSLEYFDQINFKNKEIVVLLCSAKSYGGHLDIMNLFMKSRHKERGGSGFVADLKKIIIESIEHKKISEFQYLYYQPTRNLLEMVTFGTGTVSFFKFENGKIVHQPNLTSDMATVNKEVSAEGWQVMTIKTKVSFFGVASRRELKDLVLHVEAQETNGDPTLFFNTFCHHLANSLNQQRTPGIALDNTVLCFWMGTHKLQLV